MVRFFKFSWLIMAVAISLMCFSCGNGNDGSNSNVESNNDRITNEPVNKIDKDSLDAIADLFDNALCCNEKKHGVVKTDCKLEYKGEYESNWHNGESLLKKGETIDYLFEKDGDDKHYYWGDGQDGTVCRVEKSKVEVNTKKIYAVSSVVLEKWTAVFENSKGETVRMFKIDYNGHRIEDVYKCVLLIDDEEERTAVYFGENNGNNGYYDPSKDYSVNELSNYDYNKKYYEGNKLQCNLYRTGIGDYEYGFSFDAENRKIILSGTEYAFKGLIRNK